jgi:sugar lactone lactonase YvrE
MRRHAALLACVATLLITLVPAGTPPAYADPAGIEPFAGTGVRGSSGDGGPAKAAQLDYPDGIAVSDDGTVYVSDMNNHKVRAVLPNGVITTVAGTGSLPHGGPVRDGVPATRFDLSAPADLAVGSDHSLYIADLGSSQVFKVAADGRITVFAGNGKHGFAGDGGPAVAAEIGQPIGLAVGPDGTVYIGDPDNARVRAVAPDGVITTAMGNGLIRVAAAGGAATGLPVPAATGIANDGRGNIWIADSLLLQRFSDGRLATVTLPGASSPSSRWSVSSAASWPPADPPMNDVLAVAAHDGSVYVWTPTELRRFGSGQRVETVAVSLSHSFRPIAATSNAVYLVDASDNRIFITHPAPPAAAPSGGEPTGPWWLFAAIGVAVLAASAVVLGLGRRRRSHGSGAWKGGS